MCTIHDYGVVINVYLHLLLPCSSDSVFLKGLLQQYALAELCDETQLKHLVSYKRC